MKIIISPAKKMITDSDTFAATALPLFVNEATRLAEYLRRLDSAALKSLWQCSDKLVADNQARLADFDAARATTPAILAYEGLQYQHLAANVLSREALAYLQDHLRILSGLYGVLRPFDAVMPYRLEMQAKPQLDGVNTLYDFWGRRLYEALDESGGVIVNLASQEYARAITPYLGADDRFVTLRFGEVGPRGFKQKGTFAKMARGEMVRFMAEQQVQDLDALRAFDALHLRYDESLSDDATMTFVAGRND